MANISFKNTKDKYGYVSQAFHWAIAILIVGLFALGIIMHEVVPKGEFRSYLYGLHKSFGILVILLTLGRLSWFLFADKPAPAKELKKSEVIFSKALQGFLYLLTLAIPFSGWLISSADGRIVSFFGLFDLPALVAKSHDLEELMEETHELLAFAVIGLAALHAAAALKHHFVNKDSLLRRMLPW